MVVFGYQNVTILNEKKQLIMWLQLRLDWIICTFYAALAVMLIFLSDNETFSEVSMTHMISSYLEYILG